MEFGESGYVLKNVAVAADEATGELTERTTFNGHF
jgi:hypothetical protein